jgi:hypothetical protein
MKFWSNLSRLFNKFCENIHHTIIYRKFKETKNKKPYSEKDLLSTLSHYVTKKMSMDQVLVDKKNKDKYERKHIKRQSFDTYRNRLHPNLLNNLFNKLKKSFFMFNSKNHKKNKIQRIFAIDGSNYQANKEMHYTYNFRSTKRNTYSLFKIITLYDVEEKIPIAQHISDNFDERKLFKEFLLKYINENDIVIFDAGFYSDELYELLVNKKIKCIFRIKKNKIESKKLLNNNSEITLSMDKHVIRYDIEYKQSQKNKNDEIEYIEKKSSFYMMTNILNLNLETIKTLYHDRWFIEEYFKIIKIFMTPNNLRHKKIELIEQELIMKMIIIILARYSLKYNLKKNNNTSKNKSINFKIFLCSGVQDLIDSLLFSKNTKII